MYDSWEANRQEGDTGGPYVRQLVFVSSDVLLNPTAFCLDFFGCKKGMLDQHSILTSNSYDMYHADLSHRNTA